MTIPVSSGWGGAGIITKLLMGVLMRSLCRNRLSDLPDEGWAGSEITDVVRIETEDAVYLDLIAGSGIRVCVYCGINIGWQKGRTDNEKALYQDIWLPDECL